MRRRLCPECGAPLSTAQTARGHAQDHWGAGRGFLSAEGQRRRDMLLHFADAFADRTDDEIATLAPTNNFSVITFSELVGFMFALPAGDALYRGDPVSSRMIVFAVIGLSFVLLGPNWPWLKSRLPRRFAASITRVGSDFRWWLAVLILGFIYLIAGQWHTEHIERVVETTPTPATRSTEQPIAPPHTIPSNTISGNTSANWRNVPPGPSAGPIGPISAVELVQTFEQLPTPCVVDVTAPSDNENLRGTLAWILQYGAKCQIAGAPSPPNADEPQSSEPNTKPGLVIHWASNFVEGENVVHFFDSSAFKVSISHRLPPNSNPHLIWIDIGPGPPWKPQ